MCHLGREFQCDTVRSLGAQLDDTCDMMTRVRGVSKNSRAGFSLQGQHWGRGDFRLPSFTIFPRQKGAYLPLCGAPHAAVSGCGGPKHSKESPSRAVSALENGREGWSSTSPPPPTHTHHAHKLNLAPQNFGTFLDVTCDRSQVWGAPTTPVSHILYSWAFEATKKFKRLGQCSTWTNDSQNIYILGWEDVGAHKLNEILSISKFENHLFTQIKLG